MKVIDSIDGVTQFGWKMRVRFDVTDSVALRMAIKVRSDVLPILCGQLLRRNREERRAPDRFGVVAFWKGARKNRGDQIAISLFRRCDDALEHLHVQQRTVGTDSQQPIAGMLLEAKPETLEDVIERAAESGNVECAKVMRQWIV